LVQLSPFVVAAALRESAVQVVDDGFFGLFRDRLVRQPVDQAVEEGSRDSQLVADASLPHLFPQGVRYRVGREKLAYFRLHRDQLFRRQSENPPSELFLEERVVQLEVEGLIAGVPTKGVFRFEAFLVVLLFVER
jgi:hypothetical protein